MFFFVIGVSTTTDTKILYEIKMYLKGIVFFIVNVSKRDIVYIKGNFLLITTKISQKEIERDHEGLL